RSSASLAGVLVADGLISWDEAVIKYLPDFELKSPEYTQKLTIKNVLSHTTGLPYHTYTNMIEEGETLPALLDKLKNVDMISEPGKVYSYQNVAYSLISDVVKSGTGNSFEDEMKTRIFGPLHMANASVTYEGILNNVNTAQPHLLRGHKWKTIPISATYYNTAPAGGINASITDMAKWLMAMLGNDQGVISSQTTTQLLDPQVRATAKNRNFNRWSRIRRSYYGLGWRILNFKNDTIAYHGGYVNGYRSEVAIHPTKRIAICVLANGPGSFSDQAVPAFFNTWEKYFKKEEKEPQPVAAP
ncbi:MAG: serine hydrolase domain-containing protein, partial [Cyclobacteriaceae bacterium]